MDKAFRISRVGHEDLVERVRAERAGKAAAPR